MKLPNYCPQCDIRNAPISYMSVEFTDDGRYEVTCPKGHTSIVALQHLKFEVLFEIGVFAIRDGYFREAVSSFTASLERFHEFFVWAVLLDMGLDAGSIEKSWKAISRQSERQFGAFIFLYTREFRRTPPLLGNKRAEFRNEVIHKGKIPTRQEAVEYGQAVLDVLRPVLRETKERFPKGVPAAIRQYVYWGKGDQPSVVYVRTMLVGLSTHDPDLPEPSLQEYLDLERLVNSRLGTPSEDAP